MIERYRVLGALISQELTDLERVVARAERATNAAHRHPEDQDLYIDSTALNLHDFYAGLERIFHHIATTIDGSVPTGREWHRDLLRQMSVDLAPVRPQVLSAETLKALDEFLRFRHVVRNVYTFQFDPEQVERLVRQARPTFEQAQRELLAFANFLQQLAQED